jgi:hypothetical protein
LAIGDPFAVTNPTGVVLVWPRNFVFATWVASYFRLSVGAEVEVDLAVSQAEEDRGGAGEVLDRPGRLAAGGALGGVAQEDRAGVVDAARPAGIGQWLLDA